MLSQKKYFANGTKTRFKRFLQSGKGKLRVRSLFLIVGDFSNKKNPIFTGFGRSYD